jgi:hypothetical protein
MKISTTLLAGIMILGASCNNAGDTHEEAPILGGGGVANTVVAAAVSAVASDTATTTLGKDSSKVGSHNVNTNLNKPIKETPIDNKPVEGSYRWVISKQDDVHTLKTNYFATVNAIEHLYLRNGAPVEAMFNVSNRKGQNEVVLRLSKGSFDKNLGNKIAINILFDDKEVKTVSGEISEYMPNCVIINSANEMIGYFKKYKKMQFDLVLKEDGKYTIKFNTEKLSWDH